MIAQGWRNLGWAQVEEIWLTTGVEGAEYTVLLGGSSVMNSQPAPRDLVLIRLA
jgi:hypothetical protein